MIPSMLAVATWTPLGPNSLASDWAKDRMANLPVEKLANRALPLKAAVADVNIKVGGYCGDAFSVSCRSGRTALEK